MVFSRVKRPVWTYVVAVLVFPFGLLALLYKDRAEIVFELRQKGGQTEIRVNGDAPLEVRRALTEFER
jgi:hypothetical protein